MDCCPPLSTRSYLLYIFNLAQIFWQGITYVLEADLTTTVEPCILEQIDYLWSLAVVKPMI